MMEVGEDELFHHRRCVPPSCLTRARRGQRGKPKSLAWGRRTGTGTRSLPWDGTTLGAGAGDWEKDENEEE